jgi:membrane fusion protein, multidrug efflux system
MKTQRYLPLLLITLLALASCKDKKKENASLEAKKEQLAKLQKQQDALTLQIIQIQQEIDALDSVSSAAKIGKLINSSKIELKHFKHYIEMQGNASSKENVSIIPDMNGMVKQILVTEGQLVTKGQVLMILDDELIVKQLEEVQTQYELAKTIYEKQKSLWDQKIGSEVQFLEAKNRKESLEKNIERINSSLGKTRVKSPINGVVDEVLINTGEMAAGRQVIRVVNLDELQINADAPESFVGRIKKGDSVIVHFPAIGQTRNTTILAVGQVINPINRTFRVDVKLNNSDKALKANLLGILKVADYHNKKAIVVPTKWVQQDHDQDFVYVVIEENGKNIARKRIIKKGNTYNGETEVLDGLQPGDVLITEGSRDITDGEVVRYN